MKQELQRLEKREKERAEKKVSIEIWKSKGNESRVNRAQVRVKRREGNQIREERCLRKAMSKLIVEKQRNMEIGKGRSKKCGDQNGEKQELWRFKKELRERKEKEGKSVLRVE